MGGEESTEHQPQDGLDARFSNTDSKADVLHKELEENT